MKKIFTLAAAAAMAMGMNAQNFDIKSVDPNLACDYAGVCEIDIDNDGIKEVVIGGFPNWNDIRQIIEDANGNEVEMDRVAYIMKWDGSKYVATQFSQNGVFSGGRHNCPHVIPADFNGDGNVDLYIASGGDANTINGLYLNNGNGGFDKDPRFQVLDADGNVFADPDNGELRWLPRAVDVADFNCDGLPDIVSIGWWLSATSENAMSGILLNNGDGTYTATCRDLIGNGDMTYCWALATVKAFDLNNDGYADFLVSGNIDNVEEEGERPARTWMQFLNLGVDTDPEEAVSFYELNLGDPNMGPGNFNVADFNCDGTPDIFATGEYQSKDWAFDGFILNGKIDNEGGVSYTEATSFPAAHKDIRPLNHNNVGTRAIDYNGDGYYDLFLPGWCPGMLDGSGATQAGWFLPGSATGITTYQRIPGSSEQGIFFLDYGVEGALNYTFTGYHGDDTYFADDTDHPKGRSMVFTQSGLAPTARPDAPTNVKATVDGNKVTLSWDAAASSKKNVTYEYYLKVNGKIYNGCTSFIGGEKDGIRKVLREGNAFMNKTLTLTLADGTYEWGVQTVNAALRGSVFAKGEALVVGSGDGISSVENTVVKDNAIYNIAGQRVADNFRGIAIQGGKKVIK